MKSLLALAALAFCFPGWAGVTYSGVPKVNYAEILYNPSDKETADAMESCKATLKKEKEKLVAAGATIVEEIACYERPDKLSVRPVTFIEGSLSFIK